MHCLILRRILVVIFFLVSTAAEAASVLKAEKSLSIFPIMMYDTDIGVGYGAKAKFVHYFSRKESFDSIIFNSTKGERWYVFTFSIPDIEVRQGKKYALSLDIKAEYDKLLKSNFFGIGADSKEQDLTSFTFEKKELQFTLGRGFNSFFVIEGSYVFRVIRYLDVKEGFFKETLESVGEQFSPFISLLVRYDTSDSSIHPVRGIRFLFQCDLAKNFLGNKNASFYRYGLDLRKYTLLFGSRDVLAFRLFIQKVSGSEIPLFEMTVLGGGSTQNAMRGYKMNRFQDKGKVLLNLEYRFPVWKQLGGNIFLDAGSVWSSFKQIEIQKLAVDVGWGLRYYLKNFLARFDMGFSKEGVGIYFNFGHIF